MENVYPIPSYLELCYCRYTLEVPYGEIRIKYLLVQKSNELLICLTDNDQKEFVESIVGISCRKIFPSVNYQSINDVIL